MKTVTFLDAAKERGALIFLDWCSYRASADGRVEVVGNGENIVDLRIDGKDVPCAPCFLSRASMLACSKSADSAEGKTDREIIIANTHVLPCNNCPYNNDCEVMSETIQEEENH